MKQFLPAALIVVSLASPASADTLLEKARAAAPANAPLYTFAVDYADDEDRFVMTIDQSRPMGERVIRFSPDPAALEGESAKKAERLRKRTAGNIWCNEFAANIPAGATRLSESATAVTYGFTPVAGKEAGQMAAAYKYLKAKATIAKETGAILAYEMVSPKPFKPMAVAKVDQFEMKVACTAAPDGRTHIDTLTMRLSGNAMMQPFIQTETRRISGLKALPSSGYGTP